MYTSQYILIPLPRILTYTKCILANTWLIPLLGILTYTKCMLVHAPNYTSHISFVNDNFITWQFTQQPFTLNTHIFRILSKNIDIITQTVLPCCCRCTTHVVPPGNHMHNLISDPYSSIHFIVTILITNTGISFNYSFLYILCSLISSIYIIIRCPTMVIILFFIFKLLLFKSRIVTV